MITRTQESVAIAAMHRVTEEVIGEYWSLVHRINLGRDTSSGRATTVGVTGCMAGAGTSTVALNLAAAAARVGDRPVLLVDLSTGGDIATSVGMPGEVKRSKTWAPEARCGTGIKASAIPNLFVLVAENDGDGQELTLDRRGINELLRSWETDFGWIVVDMPTPESSLCIAIAGLFDGILLTMEAERTRRNVATRARQRLLQAQANILGVILNKQRQYIPNWLDSRL